MTEAKVFHNGVHVTVSERCEALQAEHGYWEVSISYRTKEGLVTGFNRHIEYERLQADIADLRSKCGKSFVATNPVYWPPQDEFWASEHHLSQLLDNEESGLESGRN